MYYRIWSNHFKKWTKSLCVPIKLESKKFRNGKWKGHQRSSSYPVTWQMGKRSIDKAYDLLRIYLWAEVRLDSKMPQHILQVFMFSSPAEHQKLNRGKSSTYGKDACGLVRSPMSLWGRWREPWQEKLYSFLPRVWILQLSHQIDVQNSTSSVSQIIPKFPLPLCPHRHGLGWGPHQLLPRGSRELPTWAPPNLVPWFCQREDPKYKSDFVRLRMDHATLSL